MRSSGFLLVLFGLFVIYVGLSGKYPIVERFVREMFADVVGEGAAAPLTPSVSPVGISPRTNLTNPFTSGVPALGDVVRNIRIGGA